MTSESFARDVRAAVQDQIAARRVGGDVCLHTGQTYIDGDEVTVSVGHGRGGSLSMTNLGETMQRVSIFLIPCRIAADRERRGAPRRGLLE